MNADEHGSDSSGSDLRFDLASRRSPAGTSRIAPVYVAPLHSGLRVESIFRSGFIVEWRVFWMPMTPCPYLPEYDGKTAKRHGLERGAGFYLDALRFAQGHWLEGKPAQALLQLNKALSADLRRDEAILIEWPWPYAALEWILEKSADGNQGFLGNPVRHFQHLATRMSGPRKEVRITRAWKCFHISRRVLEGKGDFPLDGRQIAREGIFIPREKG